MQYTKIITYCLYVIKLKTLWKFVEAWFIIFLFKRYAYLKCHTPDISYFDFLAMICHISAISNLFL